jgi:hypothetical protein
MEYDAYYASTAGYDYYHQTRTDFELGTYFQGLYDVEGDCLKHLSVTIETERGDGTWESIFNTASYLAEVEAAFSEGANNSTSGTADSNYPGYTDQ